MEMGNGPYQDEEKNGKYSLFIWKWLLSMKFSSITFSFDRMIVLLKPSRPENRLHKEKVSKNLYKVVSNQAMNEKIYHLMKIWT